MPIESSVFVCSHCGSRYTKKEDAISCEKAFELIESYKKTLLPWKWYRLSCKHHNGSTDLKNVFVHKIMYNYSCRPTDVCLHQCVSLFSYNWNTYYNILSNWNIEEILSPMEMYKKYKVFLDEGMYFNGDTQYSVDSMPRSVAEELDAVNELVISDLVSELISSKTKEELAKSLVLAEHPLLRHTNYKERAIAYQEKYMEGQDYSVQDNIKDFGICLNPLAES